MTDPEIHEYDPNTGVQLGPLTLLGELVGIDNVGHGVYVELTLNFLGADSLPKVNGSPVLSAVLSSRTASSIVWAPITDPAGTAAATSWEVERRSSTDGGANYGAWSAITGSPFSASARSVNQTGLNTGAPEVVYDYRVRGVNAIGVGVWSNTATVQWANNPVAQPTAPTNFARSNVTNDSAQLTWVATPDLSVQRHAIFVNGVLTIDGIGPDDTSYTWSGLSPSTTYANVTVKRFNGQWSPASNALTFTTLASTPVTQTTLMGCSTSDYDHGNSNDWDAWRTYRRSELYQYANLSGSQRPLLMAYSEDGPNLGGSNPNYQTIYDDCIEELDSFYYGNAAGTLGSGTGSSTLSVRKDIVLVWSNGNENYDKGALSPAPSGTAGHTDAQVSKFLTSQKALYDAVHYAPGGTRRFPNARASSNPTHYMEKKGFIKKALHATARYHDVVMWSMYNPGRTDGLGKNPGLVWPSFLVGDINKETGYLIRCFNRTKEAQAQARIDKNSPTFRLGIGVGECGQASDPDDRSQRPYFAVHGMIGAMDILANQFDLDFPFACWWDSQVATTAQKPNPVHDILADEPTNSDHLAAGNGSAAGNNATATNPSTRVAWQNWRSYDKRISGSSQPSQWAGNPKSSWDQTGNPV